MVALNKQMSADDLMMGSVNHSVASPNTRPRSSSPAKKMNRRPMPLNFRHTPDSTEDLMSMLSGPGSGSSSISHHQLRELSRSPISRKLHISGANFAIPIPFTLQLPPKLTRSLPATPDSSVHLPSQARLVFNGSSYEPVESDDCDDAESSFLTHRITPHSPSQAKPPAVTSSRKKVAKFVEKTHSIPLDQLSMIEEASTRANSVKTKALPLVPVSPAPASRSVSRRLLKNPPPDMDPVLEAPVANRVASGVINTEAINACLQSGGNSAETSVLSTTAEPKHNDIDNGSKLANGVLVEDWRRTPNSMLGVCQEVTGCLSHTAAFHHNLNNTNAGLRIEKRTFSDESHVSSVSSFSSVGDFFNATFHNDNPRIVDMRDSQLHYAQRVQLAKPTEPAKPVQQILLSGDASTKSFVSESNEGSQASWNSLQKSLDLTLKETSSNCSATNEVQSAANDQTLVPSNETDESIETKILPLNIVRSEAEPSAVVEEDDSNNGAGISFNFPNNELNVTNLAVKKKAPNSFKNSHSAYSLVSSSGQIEIPDLDDLRIQECSQSIKGPDSGSDNLEPIGMPSRAARDHFKSMYGETSTDSDSDSSFNSLFTKLNKQNKPNVHPVKESISPPATKPAPRSSPARHARQQSMYNFDFERDVPNASPSCKYGRSRSTADLSVISKEFPSISRSPIVANLAQAGLEDSRSPKIVVADPPKKIEYAVDFKSAKVPEKEDMYHMKVPLNYYQRTSLRPRSNHSEYHTAGTSEVASSYQSSRTAGDTVSTAPTENNSVLIDLTKDGYNLCMITRKDSQMSYKSVIEKTKDGKDVEVVLIDEDDDPNNTDDKNSVERDDLLSIYSHYMNDWAVRSDFKRSDLATAGLMRTNSMLSSASEGSNMTTSSWTPTENNFHVKSIIASRREREPINVRGPRMGMAFAGKKLAGIKEAHQEIRSAPKLNTPIAKPRVELPESNYYDYSKGDDYDFKTFMEKQATSRAN